jgi:astacin (peptidase family M12A)
VNRGRCLCFGAVLIGIVWTSDLGGQTGTFVPVRFEQMNTLLAKYEAVDGMAVVEGDIVLGSVAEAEQEFRNFKGATNKNLTGLVRNGPEFRWPAFTIPYTIDPAIESDQRTEIREAIGVWNAALRPRLGRDAWITRTAETTFVTFTRHQAGDCRAEVGNRRRQQFVWLSPGCERGLIMHEMGHTMGLWHEQSRADRDRYVTIVWSNIQRDKLDNFDQRIDPRHDDQLGGMFSRTYDYDSIMHYGAYDFAINRNEPTILSPRPIGQRGGPSPLDLESVWVNQEGAGWGVRVCNGTRADAIHFEVGSIRGDTRMSRKWFKWIVGDRRDFPFPPALLYEHHIWLKADAEPDRQVNLCLVYNGVPKKSMTFDEEETADPNRGSEENDCLCR